MGPQSSLLDLFEKARTNFPHLSGLLFSVIVLAVIVGGLPQIQSSLGTVLFTCGFAALLIAWCRARRVPRTPRGKIGVVVGIVAESKQRYYRLKMDFVDELRSLLKREPQFHLIALNEYHSKRAREAPEDYYRTNARYLIVGLCRERRVGGKDKLILDFSGGIRHRSQSDYARLWLAAHHRSVLSHRYIIDPEVEFEVLEILSREVAVGAKYVIAMAALISRESDLAKSLLEGMVQHEAQLRLAKNFKARCQRALLFSYHLELDLVLQDGHWDKETLRKARVLVRKARQFGLDSPALALTECNAAFLLDNNVPEAIGICLKWIQKDKKDPAWRLSLAFLLTHEERYSDAYDQYQDAFKRKPKDHMDAVQSYIEHILETQSKKQLLFALGLIAYHGRQDYARALECFTVFTDFLASQPSSEEREFASTCVDKYIRRIREMQPDPNTS